MSLTYSAGIHIDSVKGAEIGLAAQLEKSEAKRFLKFIVPLLDALKHLPTGRKLMEAIDGSGHVCTIYCASDDKDNVASKNPSSMANDVACSVVPFRPRHENLTTNAKGNASVQAGYLAEMQKLGEFTTMKETAPELVRVLQRAQAKYPEPLKQIAQLCGISTKDFGQMLTGTKAMDDKTYYTLCFKLYDFLTPGPGCNTQLRFEPPERFQVDFKSDVEEVGAKWYQSSADVNKRVAIAVIGHELIHAWRMMTGRRIVTQGWEEEAMTAGVGPFLDWKLTENALRAELKLPSRKKYQTGQCSSDMMSGLMMQMNWSDTPVTTRF